MQNFSHPRNQPLVKSVCKAGILFCTLAGGIAFLQYYDVQGIFDHSWVDTHIKSQGWAGIFFYISLVAVLTVVVPRQALGAVGGYAFGVAGGCAWVTVGLLVNCIVTFFYARILGRSLLQQRFGKRIQRFDAFLAQNPFGMTVAIRCLPVGSNALTNLMAGVSRIAPFPFFAGSVLGHLPQNIIFSILGSGLRVDERWPIWLSAFLFVLSIILGYLLFRRYKETLDEISSPSA